MPTAQRKIYNLTLLFVFLFYILHFTFYIPLAHAQAPTQPTQPPPGQNTVNVPYRNPSAQNWDSNKQAAFSLNGMLCGFDAMASGISLCSPDGYPITIFLPERDDPTKLVPKTEIISNGVDGGALGAGARFMAQMYSNQPASGVQYLAQNIQNGIHLVNPAYAQVPGSGAAVIGPIQKIWQVARNIAYLGFVIVFIAAGLMIMFRKKLNPQTVIGLQQALPGLVIGLILVTFSYFIAGLIIDLGFLGSQAIGVIFLSQLGNQTTLGQLGNGSVAAGSLQAINKLLNEQNVITMFTSFALSGNLFGAAHNIGTQLTDTIFQGFQGAAIKTLLVGLAACLNPIGLAAIGASTLGGPATFLTAVGVCTTIGAGAGGVGGGIIVSGIVYLILLIGLLQAMFRLLFSLITSYVSIIAGTILGPFIILWSAVPGQGNVLGLWWKMILGNVLVFPTVFGMFLLIAVILGFDNPWYLNSGTVGQFNQALPLFGGAPVGFIQVILAYGLLLVSPGIPELVKELIGAKTNQILQQQFQRGVGLGATGAGTAGGAAGIATYRGIEAGAGAAGRLSGSDFLNNLSTRLEEIRRNRRRGP